MLFAIVLDLYADEAYYTLYAQYLDWGYLDHPPAVGVFIFLGQLIFDGELGVRICFILLSSASYYLIYDWIRPKEPSNVWLCLLALLPLQLMGFMALPDVPLFFFAILFFRFFQRYLEKDNTTSILLLAFAISGMLYSKYHGALIILFSFFSVPKLFTRKSFYLLAAVSVLLYFPHLSWIYQHEFSGLKYHFLERSAKAYRISYTLEYLLSFLLFNGPLVFGLLLWYSFRRKNTEAFDRVLKLNIVGIFLFFFLSSFKGRVEANWTFIALIPALYLAFRNTDLNERLMHNVALISVLFMILFRIHLLYPLMEFPKDRRNEFQGQQAWADSVMALAGNQPLIATRYQEAALLSFYSGKNITSVNMEGRKNQFDFWGWADTLENKKVYKLNRGKAPEGAVNVWHPYYGPYYVSEIESLTILRYPEIECLEAKAIGDSLHIRYRIKAQNTLNTKAPIKIKISYKHGNKVQDTLLPLPIEFINDKIEQVHHFYIPSSANPSFFEMSILSDKDLVWKTKKVNLK